MENAMPLANTAQTYGSVTKTFHWLTALLILALIPLGVIANELPYETDAQLALKAQLFSVHKTLGVLVFFVALARIIWALTQVKPGDLSAGASIQKHLAAVVHWLLYISLVIVPLSGWVHHAATSGFAPIWWPFGQNLPFVPKDEGLAETMAATHWLFSKIMIGALLLHVAGALKHHLIDKDATLRRMWFGRSLLPQTMPAAHGGLVAPVTAIALVLLTTAAATAAGLFRDHESLQSVALEQVASDWVVTDGEIAIRVTQLGGLVDGRFADWTAAISYDPDAQGQAGEVDVTIAIPSLTLGSVTAQAMGADFFAADTYPVARFTGTILRDGDSHSADGTLTIRDQVQPVSFPFDLTLTGDQAVMTGSLVLDRRDFGIGATMRDESSLGFDVVVDLAVTADR
jgi:cytochrome b561/polyisoprenoid-binding protein YceI